MPSLEFTPLATQKAQRVGFSVPEQQVRASSPYPKSAQTTLLQFASCGSINYHLTLTNRARPANLLGTVALEEAQQNRVERSSADATDQHAYHGEIAEHEGVFAVRIGWPAFVERICRDNTAQVSQPTDKCACSGDANLSMSWLENLVCPSHGDGYCWPEAKANDEESTITRPGISAVTGKCGDKEAGDLQQNRNAEKQRAVVMEAV